MSVQSLPRELLLRVFTYLPPFTLLARAALVCRHWNHVARTTFSPTGETVLNIRAVWTMPDEGRPFSVREKYPFRTFQRLSGGGRGTGHEDGHGPYRPDRWVAGTFTLEGPWALWRSIRDSGGMSSGRAVSRWVEGCVPSLALFLPQSTVFWPLKGGPSNTTPFVVHEYPEGVQWTKEVELSDADLQEWRILDQALHVMGEGGNTGDVRFVTVNYEGRLTDTVVVDALSMFPNVSTIRIRVRPGTLGKRLLTALRTSPLPDPVTTMRGETLTSFFTDFNANLDEFYRGSLDSFLARLFAAFPNLTAIGDFAIEATGQGQLGDNGVKYRQISSLRATIMGLDPDRVFRKDTVVFQNFTKRVAMAFPAITELVFTFPPTGVYMHDACDAVVRHWLEALKPLSSLRTLRFEGAGLHGVMQVDSKRLEWKEFFEKVGVGKTLVMGDEFEPEGLQPVVDEFSLEMLSLFAEAD